MSGKAKEDLAAKFMEQIKKLASEEFKKLTQTVIEHADPVTAVTLRFHLLTEHYLERIISAKLPRGDRILKNRLNYAAKLTLVHALDELPDRIIAALRALNTLRNRMSHQRDFVVTTTDIETIGAIIGQPFMDLKREHDLSDAQRFAVLTYTLLVESLVTSVITAENLPGMKEEFNLAESKK